MLHRIAGGIVMAIASLALSAVGVAAHGGVPTLQPGAERINPGGTIELLGDMTTEGPVELRLVAGTTVRSLGSAIADYEGHFQVFVIVPVDVPSGEYTVHAESTVERASAPLVVAGLPIGGEEGQLPGQDEARAGVVATADPATVDATSSRVVDAPDSDAAGASALLAVLGAVAAAFVFGAITRARARRRQSG